MRKIMAKLSSTGAHDLLLLTPSEALRDALFAGVKPRTPFWLIVSALAAVLLVFTWSPVAGIVLAIPAGSAIAVFCQYVVARRNLLSHMNYRRRVHDTVGGLAFAGPLAREDSTTSGIIIYKKSALFRRAGSSGIHVDGAATIRDKDWSFFLVEFDGWTDLAMERLISATSDADGIAPKAEIIQALEHRGGLGNLLKRCLAPA